MTWTLAAHRSELAQPGDYVLLSGAEQIAVFNLDGEIIASDNICKHRGARIFTAPHGNARLKCPYHGLEGMAAVGIHRPSAWYGEWLYVAVESDGGFPAVLDLRLFRFSEAISRRHAFDVLTMPCHYTTAIENSLEDYHVPTVHPDTFGKLGLKLDSMERFGRNSMALYTITDERTVRSLTAISKHFRDVRPDHYFHIFLWPYTCLSSLGGFSYSVQHYMPAGAFTTLHSRLYQGRTTLDAPSYDWFFNEARAFNRLTFEQDAAICSRVAGPGTYLTDAEQRVRWFREAG